MDMGHYYMAGLTWGDIASRMKKDANNPSPTSHDDAYNHISIESDPTASQVLGESIPAAQLPQYAPLLKLTSPRPTYEKGITLLEHAYTVLEDAEKVAKGSATQKDLGVSNTIATEKKKVADEADYLRKTYGEHNKNEMSILDWQTARDLFFMALDQYSAVNEGRGYQNKVFDQFIADLGTNASNLGKGAVSYGKYIAAGLGALALLMVLRK